ncbi:MAG TPA: polysaccharide deacetylase family protein [Thermoanaerobaculia bacterium]|nr:polysaccharide deacetylase family protein [Thermoanaerobaculia bacterium]
MGTAVSVDVEEWYHSCWEPEYVDPVRRPALPEELDRLIPALVHRLDELGARATFFVLGEVARRLPDRVREIARAGHEVACHGDLHLRADDRPPRRFEADVRRAKALLEEIVGAPVLGFRAPEWSLRHPGNPRFRIVAECGFRYDSSLMPAVGAGSATNPAGPTLARWSDGLELLELPPLVWGGPLRLPAGGWCGRCAAPAWVRAAAERAPFALFVVHPWELVDRPVPGLHTGFARFFHDAGRRGYGDRFERTVRGLPLGRTLGELCALPALAGAARPAAEPAEEGGALLQPAPVDVL